MLLRTDNAAVVSYIRKRGVAHSPTLCYLTWEILNKSIVHKVIVQAVHIPDMRNVLVDALSRGVKMPVIKMTEWSLDQTVVNTLFHQLGTPVINLFANIKNKKMPVFCSPFPETTAVAIDVLRMN